MRRTIVSAFMTVMVSCAIAGAYENGGGNPVSAGQSLGSGFGWNNGSQVGGTNKAFDLGFECQMGKLKACQKLWGNKGDSCELYGRNCGRHGSASISKAHRGIRRATKALHEKLHAVGNNPF